MTSGDELTNTRHNFSDSIFVYMYASMCHHFLVFMSVLSALKKDFCDLEYPEPLSLFIYSATNKCGIYFTPV